MDVIRPHEDIEPGTPELRGSDRALLLAMHAAPLAWVAQLLASVVAASWLCPLATRAPIHVATAAAVVAGVAGLGWCLREARAQHPGGLPSRSRLRRALARAGIALNGFFLLLILGTEVPGLLLPPCT